VREWRLRAIAEFLGGETKGDSERVLSGTCAIEAPEPDKVAFIESKRQIAGLTGEAVGAVIVPQDLERHFENAVIHESPRLAFAWAQVAFYAPEGFELPDRAMLDDARAFPFTGGEWRIPSGIHPLASVCEDASVAQDAEVGAFSFVEAGAEIGGGTVVYPSVYIGRDSKIGKDCRIFSNVSVYAGIEIGDRVIIHSGTVIGSDGYGFVSHSGGHTKLPQTGRVVIEDDVEIGAGCTIDRAALTETVIEKGAKLDNLIQVAHGVRIGQGTLVAAQAGISGGTRIGKWCVIGGQAGFQGHITVGDRSVVGAQSGVIGSILDNSKVSGFPARPHSQSMRSLAALSRLPEHLWEIKHLRQRLAELEKKMASLTDAEHASRESSTGDGE